MDAITPGEITEGIGDNEEGREKIYKRCYGRQCLLPSLIIFCMAIYEIAEALLKTSTRLHILRLSCLYVTQDPKVCSHEPNKTVDAEVDGRIQSVAAPYIVSYTVLLNGPAIISCLFLGSWSDRHGRKKVLMLSLVGQILACISFGFSYLPGVGYIPGGTMFLLVGVLIYGACGKSTVFLIGASSYVADCSTKERRTRLLSRLIGVGFFGNCIGYALVSLFITFQWILLAVSATAVVLLIAILLFIKETVTYDPHKIMNDQVFKTKVLTREAESAGEEKGEDRATKKGPYSKTEDCEDAMLVPPERKELTGMCFTVSHIIYFLLRKRNRCDRVHIIILLLCCFINHMVKVGENDAMLLYVTRERVGWNDKIYGAYLSANYVVMSLQLLVVYPLLERLFNPSDKTCIIFGASVRILTFAATGLTIKTSLLFVYGLLGSFGAFITCAGRSSLTKLTSEEEVGTMLALTSFLEVVSATVGSSLFTEIFVATRQHFAGTVFFILAALQGGILMSILCSRYFENKPQLHTES
ncbi:Proton-coupled folate transporter [Taenia crassiceps]|uniref:Proton-coupled folate transporter n=1 Tax=Taenia crassiceps TaxID=6207 RepID=A0ABR4QSZ0_9CEST